MNREDVKNIVLFVILIILIVFLLTFNYAKSIKKGNLDRKIIYINNMTYDSVLDKGTNTFFSMMDILLNDNFTYEKNSSNKDKIYNIKGTDYKRITNMNTVLNKLDSNELDKFMKYKGIIQKDNDYYINSNKINTNYIGSSINIDSFDNTYVIFKSINYYCDNYKYIGNIKNDIDCNYTKKESTFKTKFINDNLVINNFEDIINIIK